MARILLVDDDAFTRVVVRRIVESEGHIVEEADSGATGLLRLVDPPPIDIIILDWTMPGMDGIEFLNRMRVEPVLRDIPVVMQTARSAKGDLRAGIEAGASYYLTKPVNRDLLLTVINAAQQARTNKINMRRHVESIDIGMTLLQDARFRFRTPAQVRSLGPLLAAAFPDTEAVGVPIYELMLNAVEHGNLEITYAEKSQHMHGGTLAQEIEKRLTSAEFGHRAAEARLEREDDVVRLVIRDEGPGFDAGPFKTFDPERAFDPNGRGIAIAAMAFDMLVYNEKGNEVVAEMRLPDPHRGSSASAR